MEDFKVSIGILCEYLFIYGSRVLECLLYFVENWIMILSKKRDIKIYIENIERVPIFLNE